MTVRLLVPKPSNRDSFDRFNREEEEEEEKQYSDLNETDETCNDPKADMNDTTSKDICNDDQPISSWIGRNSSSNVEETPPPPVAIMALPFAKRSPYWKSYEANEGYKTVPQHPHFRPLLEDKEDDDDHREWSAVGMMVTFYGLLEEVKALKPNDSLSVLCGLSHSLSKLEKHGFDIDAPKSRIGKMMSLKDEKAKKAEEKQRLEKKVHEDERKSRKLGEEMAELKRREEVAKEEKEAADKRVVEMKASGERIEQEMEDVDLEFLKTASAPW